MSKVLLVDPIHEKGQQILKEAGLIVECLDQKDHLSVIEAVKEVWGIIVRTSRITEDMIKHANMLKIIGRHGAGVDNIDVAYATKQKIAVINTPDANTLSVVEYVIGAVYATAKGFAFCDKEIKSGNWSFREHYRPIDIAGSTLGIIGFGRIGKEVAEKAISLDINVLVYDPYIKVSKSTQKSGSSIKICASIVDVLENSDFLTLHVPYTSESAGLIDITKLKMMKKESFLINTSRGGVVVEGDLCQALTDGIIAGAVIDVFETEPPPSSHPFFTLGNVILTPHNAALTQSAILRASTTVAREFATFYHGGKLNSLINLDALN